MLDLALCRNDEFWGSVQEIPFIVIENYIK
jgi:hypothetical protein